MLKDASFPEICSSAAWSSDHIKYYVITEAFKHWVEQSHIMFSARNVDPVSG